MTDDLPPGWAWAMLDEVTEIQGGIQKQQKRRPVQNKYPFLRVANVLRGELDLSEVHEVELFEGELEKLRLKDGDLLVVEGNGSPGHIGRAARWHGEISDTVHQNHLIRARPGSAIHAKFLEFLWNSPIVSEQLKELAGSTSGLLTLSVSKLRRVRLPLPPLAEQRCIVAALEDQLSRLDVAIGTIESLVVRGQILRRSLLQEAFAGRLVSQDPCHEPASVLLERIQAEETGGPKSRRGRKATAKATPATERIIDPDRPTSPPVPDGTQSELELGL